MLLERRAAVFVEHLSRLNFPFLNFWVTRPELLGKHLVSEQATSSLHRFPRTSPAVGSPQQYTSTVLNNILTTDS